MTLRSSMSRRGFYGLISALVCFVILVAAYGCRTDAAPVQKREPHLTGDLAGTADQRAFVSTYEAGVLRHANITYEQFKDAACKEREYVSGPGFDPAVAKYFDLVKGKLALTDAELASLRGNGFAVINMNRRLGFASAYHELYNIDLPVLVTTDSVLHALHATYDRILAELETTVLRLALDAALRDAHEGLASRAAGNPALAANWQDVDLYLTIARNLLAGAGEPEESVGSATPRTFDEISADQIPLTKPLTLGGLPIKSKLGQDANVLAVLRHVQSLVLQFPERTFPTDLYGGQRYVDYSQFAPRGHYAAKPQLRGYFRCMMWLGRADCGWNVLKSAHIPCLSFDADRELRDASLMTALLEKTGGLKRLSAIDTALEYLVGGGDEMGPSKLAALLHAEKLAVPADLAGPKFSALRKAVATGGVARQAIRSQVVISDPNTLEQVEPPAIFQVFGQRFCADSFVLSKVVYDSILYGGKKQERLMPSGLDVMAAFGHDAAIPLLEPELRQWNYAANLMACRSAVETRPGEFWEESFYNGWLDAIRGLGQDLSPETNAPHSMKTRAWCLKQLQAALGSWSELRHDNLLYAKQSYTAGISCEYPAGYVEPYPAVYARLRQLTSEASRRIGALDVAVLLSAGAEPAATREVVKRQAAFLTAMAETFATLETLARKELAAKPFTADEQTFLRRTVERKPSSPSCGVPPEYDGWYYNLLYGSKEERQRWAPTVADLHTNPNSGNALHAAVGDAHFCVVAVDNGSDRAIYVGPVYSYYEFQAPAEKRLTDEAWQMMLQTGAVPQPPGWTTSFRNAPRSSEKPTSGRIGNR